MSPASKSPLWAALLRGVNVGGNNKLPMKDLAKMFEASGCQDVQTYIQSGNVVFRAPRSAAESLTESLPKKISARFGFAPPLVVRSHDELVETARKNPFRKKGIDDEAVAVLFLAHTPTAASVKALDPQRSPPDEFAVVGRELYLHCPNGLARTKLTNAYFDRALATMSTGRNWRTLLKLIELTG